MRALVVMVGVGLALGLAVGADAAGTRVAFVDVQKVLVRSVAGVAAREQLEKESAPIKKDLETRRSDIDKLREELEKKGLLLSAEAKRQKEEDLQRKVRDFRRYADDGEKELQRKEQQLTQRLLQELTGVIEQFGKEKGFLMIIEKRGASVIYGDAEADITEDIIKVYDQVKAKKP